MPRLPLTDSGVADELLRLVRLATSSADMAVSADRAQFGMHVDAAGRAMGTDLASLGVTLSPVDAGVGADLARMGVRPCDSANASDHVVAAPGCAAVAAAVGVDVATVPGIRGISSATNALGGTTAIVGFTPHAAASTAITAVGTTTYVIPVWCRYIDVVLLAGGGGGGGAGGNPLYPGEGGDAAAFVTQRLERGVDISWATGTLTVSVGDGGAAGVGGPIGGTASAGGPTTLSAVGLSTITASGGRGGTGSAVGITYDQNGDGVVPVTFNGVAYNGGGPVMSGNGTVGNAPGGGGRGGNAGIFLGSAGGKGAPGQAWLRAYQ